MHGMVLRDHARLAKKEFSLEFGLELHCDLDLLGLLTMTLALFNSTSGAHSNIGPDSGFQIGIGSGSDSNIEKSVILTVLIQSRSQVQSNPVGPSSP